MSIDTISHGSPARNGLSGVCLGAFQYDVVHTEHISEGFDAHPRSNLASMLATEPGGECVLFQGVLLSHLRVPILRAQLVDPSALQFACRLDGLHRPQTSLKRHGTFVTVPIGATVSWTLLTSQLSHPTKVVLSCSTLIPKLDQYQNLAFDCRPSY